MGSRVSSRGQITIDREARHALAVKPGMTAVQVVVDDHLEVCFIPAPHRRSSFGSLPPRERVGVTDWNAVEKAASESIAREA